MLKIRGLFKFGGLLALKLITVIIGVTTLLFILSQFAGDPATLYSEPSAPEEVLVKTRERMGLNDPILIQYLRALKAPFLLSFEHSYAFQGPVLGVALKHLATSSMLIFLSLALSVVIATTVGLIAALNPSRWIGRVVLVSTYVTQAIPYFWLAILLVLFLAVRNNFLPATGSEGWMAYVIPVFVLSVYGYSTLARLARGQLLDAFGQEFVTTARSKGLRPLKIITRHAFPAGAGPVLAWIGIEFSFLISALLVLEPLLNFNGVGTFLINGVRLRDFPVVQVSVILIAVSIATVNAVLDAVAKLFDPRIGMEAS